MEILKFNSGSVAQVEREGKKLGSDPLVQNETAFRDALNHHLSRLISPAGHTASSSSLKLRAA
jgi:hypothetical protein